MPDDAMTPYAALTAAARNVVTASEAVNEGIATHAEKHDIVRRQQRKELAAKKRLSAPLKPSVEQ